MGFRVQRAFYCSAGHAEEAQRQRDQAKRPERYKTTCVAVQCEGPGCAVRFVPNRKGVRFHSRQCNHAHHNRSRDRGGQKRAGDVNERQSASGRALLRACFDVCLGCRSPLSCDGPLVYCVRRCGWTDLLSAKQRDPRAGTPDPVEETDEP